MLPRTITELRPFQNSTYSEETDQQARSQPNNPHRLSRKIMPSLRRSSVLLRTLSSTSKIHQASARSSGCNSSAAVAATLGGVLGEDLHKTNSTIVMPTKTISSSCSCESSSESNEDDTANIDSKDESFDQSTSSVHNFSPIVSLESVLEDLGRNPSPEKLARVAGQRAKDQIENCLSGKNGNPLSCPEKFRAVPEYFKSDLIIGKFLGKGTFSDAFEITLVMEDDKPITSESLSNDADDLETIFAGLETKFTGVAVSSSSFKGTTPAKNGGGQPAITRRNSICVGSNKAGPVTSSVGRKHCERSVTLVMKCLRPKIRSDPEQFLIGVDDLIHETAILASLDHPNIVKLHGRASGDLTKAFQKLDDGYFILLDRLQHTLEDRIDHWKQIHPAGGGSAAPLLSQVSATCQLAEVLDYLHGKNIIYRDLKPSNVGFDSSGTVKLFDFGLAAGIPDDRNHMLYEPCVTPRYMAPEVALVKGYGLKADVYSFGILAWEIFTLKKPFSSIKTSREFRDAVFVKGKRPKLGKTWSIGLKELVSSCWEINPDERPGMDLVKTMMNAFLREMSKNDTYAVNAPRPRKMFKRLTWDI
mmetsp:Transcript_5355/g.10989  ORF Transcript_5355/g.10989 Transcript_5355/m.10989 type:complete len:588 (+) Transcript_5355:95-1858(+)